MKKCSLIIIFVLFASITFNTHASMNEHELKNICENLKVDPQLNFYTSYGKLEYNTNYSRDQLSQLGKNFGIFEEGDLASGLALVDVASEYELSTSSRTMINKAACIVPQELSVYIGFQNPVIYLANDLKKYSCLYNLVVRHEQVHQQINVNALEYFIPIIYDRIKLIVNNMRPMYVSSQQKIKSGTNDMTVFYAEQINNLVEEFKQEILLEQRKLDNRKQYNLESDICKRYNEKNQH